MDAPVSLHVLLTNDDGHQAPGIPDHGRGDESPGVTVSAWWRRGSEQSATSMSTTTRRNLALEEFGDREAGTSMPSRPTPCWWRLRHLLHEDPPDLVLSGINFGPNLGVGLHASGTIGAAIIALLHGYPAIAVSAGMHFHEARQEVHLNSQARTRC